MYNEDEISELDVQVDEKDIHILELFRLLSTENKKQIIAWIEKLQSER